MLNRAELTSLFHGVLSVRFEEDGYILPRRSVDEQIAYVGSVREDFGEKLQFATSVTLEFTTDATAFSFEYVYENVKNLRGGIDVWVNGKLRKIFYADESCQGVVELELEAGEKSVVVYFPCEKQTKIKNVSIDGNWTCIPPRKEKLLAMGDSITSGVGCEVTSYSYINVFNRKYGYELINQGIGGYVYDEGFLMPLDDYYPDKILISLGTNQHKSGDKREKIEKFFEKLAVVYPAVPTLVITPIWRMDGNADIPALCETVEIIKNACAKYENITVVNGFDLLIADEAFFADRLHPNSFGGLLYGEALASVARF